MGKATSGFRHLWNLVLQWGAQSSGSISVFLIVGGHFFGWNQDNLFRYTAYGALLICAIGQGIKIWAMEERLRPKLKLTCGKDVPGSYVSTVMNFANAQGQVFEQSQANFFRIVTELNGVDSVENCSGFITRIEKNGEVRMANESLQLTFAPGDRADAIAKTIRNKIPAHLDVLTILQDNKVMICLPGFRAPNAINNQNMFSEQGDYVLTVVVAGNGIASVSTNLIFRWTGDSATAEVFTKTA